jgi:hypothetical protein
MLYEMMLLALYALLRRVETNKEQQGSALAVFLRLTVRFWASSAVAWISLILYTSCLPIQGLTIEYITKAFAEATPESSFWELFRPGKIRILSV